MYINTIKILAKDQNYYQLNQMKIRVLGDSAGAVVTTIYIEI